MTHHESDEEALRRVLAQGLGRFREIVSDRHLELPQHGSWEIAAIIRGERPPASPNLQFLGTLLPSNPNYTGWPVWLDSRNFGIAERSVTLQHRRQRVIGSRFW